MNRKGSRFIEVAGLIKQTEKAVLVKRLDDGKACWIAKSQCQMWHSETSGTVLVRIAGWLRHKLQIEKVEPPSRGVKLIPVDYEALEVHQSKSRRSRKPQSERPVPASADTSGSFAEAGTVPEPGQIAWVIVPKASAPAELKSARCKVVSVAEQLVVKVTKTGQQFVTDLAVLFDHVPHCENGLWV
jgi:hypothetical protein